MKKTTMYTTEKCGDMQGQPKRAGEISGSVSDAEDLLDILIGLHPHS